MQLRPNLLAAQAKPRLSFRRTGGEGEAEERTDTGTASEEGKAGQAARQRIAADSPSTTPAWILPPRAPHRPPLASRFAPFLPVRWLPTPTLVCLLCLLGFDGFRRAQRLWFGFLLDREYGVPESFVVICIRFS